jgi:hypothetical protein
MGSNGTSVTDEQTTVASGPPAADARPAGRTRMRRPRVLALSAAVAAVAAGAVVWSTAGAHPVSADRRDAGTTRADASATASDTPSEPTAAVATDPAGAATIASSAPSSAKAAGPSASAPVAAVPPAGWEPRTFQGVTFAVPPGAQTPDTMDPGNADAPALFAWNGPSLGEDTNAQVTVWIHPAADAPALGPEYQSLPVPGADQAHFRTGPTGSEPATVAVDLHIVKGGRFVNIVAVFAAGPAGEQMVRDLLASVSIA